MKTEDNESVSVNIPVTECWDVLVAGGGPAGCAAVASEGAQRCWWRPRDAWAARLFGN